MGHVARMLTSWKDPVRFTKEFSDFSFFSQCTVRVYCICTQNVKRRIKIQQTLWSVWRGSLPCCALFCMLRPRVAFWLGHMIPSCQLLLELLGFDVRTCRVLSWIGIQLALFPSDSGHLIANEIAYHNSYMTYTFLMLAFRKWLLTLACWAKATASNIIHWIFFFTPSLISHYKCWQYCCLEFFLFVLAPRICYQFCVFFIGNTNSNRHSV